ncbi:hypothetical protein ACIBJF_46565 [Streptomyces sp. NPDC050743]|uniref:hypothetical protein n=1 Tax=Streptomyces sp. NPDC050743 TaxID=3365634 RepID=UPI0037A3B363
MKTSTTSRAIRATPERTGAPDRHSGGLQPAIGSHQNDGPTYREPAPRPDGITSVHVVEEFDFHHPKIVRLLVDGFFPNQQRTYLRELEKALA